MKRRTGRPPIKNKQVKETVSGSIFSNYREAAIILGLDRTAVYRCAEGKQIQTNGYRFEYILEDPKK